MSRKGVSTAAKSKQIPRIFRNRRSPSSSLASRVWVCNADVIPSEQTAEETHACTRNIPISCLEEANDTFIGKRVERRKRIDSEKVWCLTTAEAAAKSAKEATVKTNTDDSRENRDNSADVETVADIEKWLKTRTESMSSMDLDTMKSEDGVERYLTDELPHSFLTKDPDALSIDIGLSDKKLNLGYEHSILQDLQSEKLLEVCEKDDEFILPEFRLDQLDSLTLSPDDMMVAGEILPSTSNQVSLSTSCIPGETIQRENTVESQTSISERNSTRIIDTDLPIDLENISMIDNTMANQNKITSPLEITEPSANPCTDVLNPENLIESVTIPINMTASNTTIMEQLKSKATKIKLEPRIIKKQRKMNEKFDKKIEPQEGVMAVVAISTDKISNMTQIVINTGTEEQIYQGKTSELIEATGSFSRLPKTDTSTTWRGPIDYSTDTAPNSQQELIISNALEELGITDDNLQPTSVTEHGKLWLCPKEDCNRQFSRLYALKGHLLAHYGVRPFKCDFEGCAWAFYSEFKLKRHKETHLKRKDYVCEVEGCNRRFTTIYNLWSHEKLHSRPNRIICQVPACQEKFQTKRALELHMKSHDQSHAPYVCKHEGCGKRYYSSNALTSHQRCHSYKEIDVKCSWPGCGKVFDKPCRLKAHIRSHTGCKPYLCTFQGCQWAFSSSSKLKRHQKKHTNERKFVCDIVSCGKAFMRSEHLKEHRLTHKEGRYFQCYICDTRFSAKSSLYVHIKKHQNKEDVVSNSQKRVKKKESQCSRVNPLVKSKRKSTELNEEIISQNPSVPVLSEPSEVTINATNENQNLEATIQGDELTNTYSCPTETCTTEPFIAKTSLRTHILESPISTEDEVDKTLQGISTEVNTNMDYSMYSAPSSTSENTEQMIMVTSCDDTALVVSTSSKRDISPTEAPTLNMVLRSEITQENSVIEDKESSEQQHDRKDQGSARTDLTFSDIWKLKTNNALMDSVVGASDIVLGANDIGEELLFTEELPSMYYQDEVVGTEYQVLLLDSGPSESTINLRGLE